MTAGSIGLTPPQRLRRRNDNGSRSSSHQCLPVRTPQRCLAAAESCRPLGAIHRILVGRSDAAMVTNCRVNAALRSCPDDASAAGAPISAALTGTQADSVSEATHHELYRLGVPGVVFGSV